MQEEDHLVELPASFFLQNILQLYQQRWVILRFNSLAIWKIVNEEYVVLIPKNRSEYFSRKFLHSEFFGGGVSRYAATPLIAALSPSHSDITTFCPWSPIATKKFQNLLRRLAPLTFLIRVQAFRDQLRGELPHVQILWMEHPSHSREMPSWSAIDLSEIQRSSKISSWIWSIICGVAAVLCRLGRSAKQMEKSRRLNWATHFLMVGYDGACFLNVSVRMAW